MAWRGARLSEAATVRDPCPAARRAGCAGPGIGCFAACVSCHGADGLSVILDAPNLAGEVNIYIDTQLKAFRLGKRKHEIMSEIAAEMTDEEIRAVANWYSKVVLEVEPGG